MTAGERRYIQRVLDDDLDALLRELPAIALEGAKGVGKTATARERARTFVAFDDEDQRVLVAADYNRALTRPRPILLDEWQLLAPVWDRVRREVDDGAPPGSFLLTGSAAPADARIHSGAGRIVTILMRPMSLAERHPGDAEVSLRTLLRGGCPDVSGHTGFDLERYVDEIVRSGFPGIRDFSDRVRNRQLDGYLERVVDRDFREFGQTPRNPDGLRRWMAAYAAATATVASFERIRDAATATDGNTPARSTVLPYRDILQRLFLLDGVPGWLPTRNHLKRVALPVKHHLVDPALAARLLGVTADGLLDGDTPGPSMPRDGTLLGALFESLVTQSVRVYAQAAGASVFHLRTQGGRHEVDLIVERPDGRVLAIEVKLGNVVRDDAAGHLNWLGQEVRDDLIDRVVVTTGADAYRRPDGVAVVPALLLGP